MGNCEEFSVVSLKTVRPKNTLPILSQLAFAPVALAILGCAAQMMHAVHSSRLRKGYDQYTREWQASKAHK